MDKIKDLLLFFSAFLPMYVLILLKLVVDIICGNKTMNVLNTINILTFAFLIIAGIIGIIWNVYKCNIKLKRYKQIINESMYDNHNYTLNNYEKKNKIFKVFCT